MKRTPNYKTMSDTDTNSGLTLVLIGFQGSGKSSTGNTILKRKSFRSGMGTVGTTNQIDIEKCTLHGNTLAVVDTPPLSSIETLSAIKGELSQQQLTTAVYAIVIAVGRFTEAEQIVVGRILSNFHSFMQDRTLLIFTRKRELDGFEPAEDKLEAWLDTTPTIQTWIKTYKLRYFAIENLSEEYDKTDDIIETAVGLIHQKLHLIHHEQTPNVSALKPLHHNPNDIQTGWSFAAYFGGWITWITHLLHTVFPQK